MIALNYCYFQCPYCHKDDSMEYAVSDKKFCLQKTANGKPKFKTDHHYYYQVDYVDFGCCVYSITQVMFCYIPTCRFKRNYSVQECPTVTSLCIPRRNCM